MDYSNGALLIAIPSAVVFGGSLLFNVRALPNGTEKLLAQFVLAIVPAFIIHYKNMADKDGYIRIKPSFFIALILHSFYSLGFAVIALILIGRD